MTTTNRPPTCQHCGDSFMPKIPTQKYCCPDCSYGAAIRKQRGRNKVNGARIYNEAAQALEELKANRKKAAPIRRATTLAETDEIPATTALRGDYLTGGAAATMQAVSGGRNLTL